MKAATGILLTIVTFFAALFYVVNSGIPFVEGDKVITSGEAYYFRIGMTKPDVFESITKNYALEDYYLRSFWLKQASFAGQLESFENRDWKDHRGRWYSEHKTKIRDFEKLTPPFAFTDRWDIEMPTSWVNTIYLEFENGKLIQIQKSRWLYERP